MYKITQVARRLCKSTGTCFTVHLLKPDDGHEREAEHPSWNVKDNIRFNRATRPEQGSRFLPQKARFSQPQE